MGVGVRLKPELEKLVAEDVQREPYRTANEFVERVCALTEEKKRARLVYE